MSVKPLKVAIFMFCFARADTDTKVLSGSGDFTPDGLTNASILSVTVRSPATYTCRWSVAAAGLSAQQNCDVYIKTGAAPYSLTALLTRNHCEPARSTLHRPTQPFTLRGAVNEFGFDLTQGSHGCRATFYTLFCSYFHITYRTMTNLKMQCTPL